MVGKTCVRTQVLTCFQASQVTLKYNFFSFDSSLTHDNMTDNCHNSLLVI